MSNTPAHQHLLLCATHRTGSNVLEQYLKATRLCGRPREYYSPELVGRFAARKELPDPKNGFLAYHRAITERWTTSNGVFSAKIMWRHLDAIQKWVSDDPNGADFLRQTPWETVNALHPTPMVVHVTRRDKVRQAVSMVRAKQSGVYTTVHLDKGERKIASDGDYDFHHLRYHVEKFTKEDEAWVALFKKYNVPVQTIVFEEFIKDPQNHTVSLLRTLGFPEPEHWHWPSILIRPQSDPASAEWAARYHEDLKTADLSKDHYRERRHRARKAMERIAARNNRWQRWENSTIGRMGIALERWWVRNEPEVNPEDAKGDGVKRPKEEA